MYSNHTHTHTSFGAACMHELFRAHLLVGLFVYSLGHMSTTCTEYTIQCAVSIWSVYASRRSSRFACVWCCMPGNAWSLTPEKKTHTHTRTDHKSSTSDKRCVCRARWYEVCRPKAERLLACLSQSLCLSPSLFVSALTHILAHIHTHQSRDDANKTQQHRATSRRRLMPPNKTTLTVVVVVSLRYIMHCTVVHN